MSAPKHRADRHEDSCSLACGANVFGVTCARYFGRHRAEAS